MNLAIFRPRKRNSHRADAEKRCPPFLQWLRSRECLLAGKAQHVCKGRVRACHVDYAGDKGVGTKVSDKFAVPMCDGAHQAQHDLGWDTFESLYKFKALPAADRLWNHWLTGTSMGRIWTKRQAEAAE